MKSLGLVLAVLVVSGCSSTPVRTTSAPYCHTSQTIETVNRSDVTSKTVVECTDDTVKRMTQVRMGIAPSCGEYKYFINLNNQLQERRGYACQKFDGSWEVLPHPSSFK